MKVNHTGHSPTNEVSSTKQGGRATGTHEAKRATAHTAEKATTSDAKAEISSKSKEFARAKAVAASASDIREDRVSDLKRRIADGSYRVDSDAIADRMVDEHLNMSGIG